MREVHGIYFYLSKAIINNNQMEYIILLWEAAKKWKL
jgi:hypothetical protein